MIRSISLVVMLMLGVVLCFGQGRELQQEQPELTLHIAAGETTVIQGRQPQLTATISNKGKRAVTLVLPGDGSESGWRTPLIGWSAVKVDTAAGTAIHPKTIPLQKGPRCGNVNPLKKTEVFVLGPGESKKLNEWIGSPRLAEPGTYSVVFYYANEPDLQWRGEPLGKHDSEAMKQVQTSHKCLLASNELRLVVKVPRPSD